VQFKSEIEFFSGRCEGCVDEEPAAELCLEPYVGEGVLSQQVSYDLYDIVGVLWWKDTATNFLPVGMDAGA
jgi:hypothetical protein